MKAFGLLTRFIACRRGFRAPNEYIASKTMTSAALNSLYGLPSEFKSILAVGRELVRRGWSTIFQEIDPLQEDATSNDRIRDTRLDIILARIAPQSPAPVSTSRVPLTTLDEVLAGYTILATVVTPSTPPSRRRQRDEETSEEGDCRGAPAPRQ